MLLSYFEAAAVGEGDADNRALVGFCRVRLARGGDKPHGLTPVDSVVEGAVDVLLLSLLLQADSGGEGGGDGDFRDAWGSVLDVKGEFLRKGGGRM